MKFHSKIATDLTTIKTDYLVLALPSKFDLRQLSDALGSNAAATISNVQKSGDFTGADKQSCTLYQPAGFQAQRVLLIGLGNNASLSNKHWFELLSTLCKQLLTSPAKNAHVVLPAVADMQQAAADLASQIYQHAYKYSATLGKPESVKAAKLKSVYVLTDKPNKAAVGAGLAIGDALGQGLGLTRELGNLPANVCTPSYLQQTAETIAGTHSNFTVNTLEEADMQAQGMGALLSVAAGTVEPAKLIVIHYNGHPDAQPTALVGKGVTFDTGGISLKPSAKMDEMKYDMCGAASVLGVMQALAILQPPINVIGVIPATENMPAGNATKPGDVVTSMSGKTIEILNTDAEGRLILCDALSYTEQFQPKATIDIATLTGACIVALGHHRSALYGNNQELVNALLAAGEKTQDLAWQMPLDDSYSQQLKSSYADLANIGGPAAGSVTAACFLAKFAENQTWAHLDIAGAAWNTKGIKGASGRPVSLLFNYLLTHA